MNVMFDSADLYPCYACKSEHYIIDGKRFGAHQAFSIVCGQCGTDLGDQLLLMRRREVPYELIAGKSMLS